MTHESWKRLENAQNNVKAAQLLAENEYYDIAATRAYYAMFYTAEALLLEKGLTFRQHEPVFTHFKELYAQVIPAFQCYHSYLLEGYQARLLADYNPLIHTQRAEAFQQINRARAFLSCTGDHLLSHSKNFLTDVVQQA